MGADWEVLRYSFIVSRASNISSYIALINKQAVLLVGCIYERIMHALIDFFGSQVFVVMFIILSIVTLELKSMF